MKRCVICGNIGDENQTICEKCGNPYVDMPNTEYTTRVETQTMKESKTAENKEMEKGQAEEKDTESSAVNKPVSNRVQNGAPRRRKSGPQIYGQSEMPSDRGQGTVRRNVSGQTAQRTPVNRPMNGAQGTPANRPMNGVQGSSANRPVNGVQGTPAGRPVNGVQGTPAGRPVNGMQGTPAGRPVNGMQGTPAGRPMNGMQGMPAGRPMNGAQGMPLNRPSNPPQMRPLYNAGQIMETARKTVESPLFLLVALLNTVYLISAIASIFLKELNFSAAARLLSGVSLPTQFVGYMDKFLILMSTLDTDAFAVNMILRVPDILFCIGLWGILISAKKAEGEMSGAGFGFVKASLLIHMIKNCVLLLIGLIVSVSLTVAAWVSKSNSMIVASTVTMVLMIVLAMMVIMYYFCYMATFKTVRLNAGSGEEYGRVSGYVAVIEIILAMTGIVNLLSGIVNVEISAITSAVGKMGWMILFAVWIFSYRNRMSEFEEEN